MTSGKPCALAVVALAIGGTLSIWLLMRLLWVRRNPDPEVDRRGLLLALAGSGTLALLGAIVWLGQIQPISGILVPMPFFIMMGLAVIEPDFGVSRGHSVAASDAVG